MVKWKGKDKKEKPKTSRESLWRRIIFKEPEPFSEKRDLNKKGIGILSGSGLFILVIVLLFMPSQKDQTQTFRETREDKNSTSNTSNASRTSEEGNYEGTSERGTRSGFGGNNVNGQRYQGANGTGSKVSDGPMILARESGDPSSQIPPGTGLQIRFSKEFAVSSEGSPVLGEITKSVLTDEGLEAIPAGSKIFGEANYDSRIERAQITWNTVLLPDGRKKEIAAIGRDSDGLLGIEGEVHSEAWKNTTGELLLKFAGAAADGAVERGSLGANPGGIKNGLLQGASEVAGSKAKEFGEKLKRPVEWIILQNRQESQAILTKTFTFRDPGGVH